MSYTPINIPAYVASYSGAVAGMGVSGWVVDPTQGNYDAVTKIAGAFAEAFDTAWNDAAQLNNLELAAITAIVSTEFSQRGPGPLANPVFQVAANWSVPAKACIALVLESDAYFAGQSINPGTPGGGGTTVRLPGIAYVDASNPQATPDGSVVNPFTTVTAAVAAVTADGLSMSSILIYPGDYSAELAIDWVGGTNVLFAAANNASIMWQGTVPLANLPDLSFGFGQTQFVGLDVGVITDLSGVGITLIDCTTRNSRAITSNGGVVNMTNCGNANGSVIRVQNIRCRDCELGNSSYTIDGTLMLIQSCIFDGAPTIVCNFGSPGSLTIDGWSKALLTPLAPALTNIAYDLQNALA